MSNHYLRNTDQYQIPRGSEEDWDRAESREGRLNKQLQEHVLFWRDGGMELRSVTHEQISCC